MDGVHLRGPKKAARSARGERTRVPRPPRHRSARCCGSSVVGGGCSVSLSDDARQARIALTQTIEIAALAVLAVARQRCDQTRRGRVGVGFLGHLGRFACVLGDEHRLDHRAIALLVKAHPRAVIESTGHDHLTGGAVAREPRDARQLVVAARSGRAKPRRRQYLLDLRGVRATRGLAGPTSPEIEDFWLAAELRSATP